MKAVYLLSALALITLLALYALPARKCDVLPQKAESASAVTKRDNDLPVKQLNHQAIALQNQGRYSEALALYQKAIAVDPQQPALHNNLALLLKTMDLLPQAEREAAIAI